MTRDPRIIENIKKLKELGMSKKDIKENLIKMGLSEEDSLRLIDESDEQDNKAKEEAKVKEESKEAPKKETIASAFIKEEIPENFFESETEVPKPKPPQKEEPKVEKPKEEKIEIMESLPDITKDLDLDMLNVNNKKEEFEEKTSNTIDIDKKFKEKFDKIEAIKSKTKPIPKVETNWDKDLTKPTISEPKIQGNVWESGLATTINTKLNEIEQKQSVLEDYIKDRIDQELEKYKKIQSTNTKLMMNKLTQMVGEQEQALNTQITKQLAMIKIEQAKLNKKISEINSNKEDLEKIIENVNEINKEQEKNNKVTQNNLNKLTLTTTSKINIKLKEINDILALQSRITQGLVKNTQNAVVEEVKKLNEFKEKVSSQINPKELYDKLSELESFKHKLASRYDNRFEGVKNEFLNKAKVAYKKDIENQLSELNKIKNTIVAKTDPEIINKKLEELEKYKKLLLTSIDEKISNSLRIYESAVTQEIKTKLNTIEEVKTKMEKEFKNIKIAEDKIKEIDKFKEQFIVVIDKNIEKMNSTMKEIKEKIEKKEDQKDLKKQLLNSLEE